MGDKVSDTQPGVKMEFNLVRLRARLQLETGEEVTWQDIADATGLHRNTVYNLAYNKTRRVDLSTLEAVLGYFRSKGLYVDPGDLFTLQEVNEAA